MEKETVESSGFVYVSFLQCSYARSAAPLLSSTNLYL